MTDISLIDAASYMPPNVVDDMFFYEKGRPPRTTCSGTRRWLKKKPPDSQLNAFVKKVAGVYRLAPEELAADAMGIALGANTAGLFAKLGLPAGKPMGDLDLVDGFFAGLHSRSRRSCRRGPTVGRRLLGQHLHPDVEEYPY